ncbi:hypothetical protein VP424E501_P0065 [Vibrio phage 424E50-1]|nr:hypothetical protein VP424E501_P0065 [Vibrio phage 424E50-1]
MIKEEDLQRLFEYLHPFEANDNKYHIEFEYDEDTYTELLGIGFYKEGGYCWNMTVQEILFNYIIARGI